MNSSTITLASQLSLAQTYITRYFMIPVYIFGNIGNLMNILLFFQPGLHLNNTCSWYFISFSIANLLLIDISGTTRTLPFVTTFTLESSSLAFCKIRYYFAHFTLLLGRYFICLIAIDRWMVTSSNESIRRLSSIKTARYLIIGGTAACAIFSVHAAIGYEIKSNRCYVFFGTAYNIFFNVYNILSIVIPIVLMILFSILIIMNIRHSRHRINVVSDSVNSAYQLARKSNPSIQMKFIRLALIQSLTFTLFNTSYAAYVTYDFATSSQGKSVDRQAIEGFIYAFSIHLCYIFASFTFLTYTLASSIFRKECMSMIRRLCTKILQWCG
ncbi:unnamed protein product [Adineta ricciae]|uniref:G-protein coupled receptors family 1 profile domain-containing protein n=1 Tax=Adineta ricciae TaxID=249248 RepID=A0A814DA44_ADIRI|nr:unnamed protein product [Adineta ricciae]CAF1267041.1 unnamed protein product [Adineta ricciae]